MRLSSVLLRRAARGHDVRIFRGDTRKTQLCRHNKMEMPAAIVEPASREIIWSQQCYIDAASAQWDEATVAVVQDARWSNDAIKIVTFSYNSFKSDDVIWTSKTIQAVCKAKWSSELVIASIKSRWESTIVQEICASNRPQDVLLAAANSLLYGAYARNLITSNRSQETVMALIGSPWCDMVDFISIWTDAMVLSAIDSKLTKSDIQVLATSGWSQTLIIKALNATKTQIKL